jgi:hypothetical protein
MSPRAACGLKTLGFDPDLVFDYVLGKADWLANGLPREGETTSVLYAGEAVDPDPPTCAVDTRAADIGDTLDGCRYDFALVVTNRRIVLGRVRRSALADADPSSTAEQLMEPGPSTVRFNTRADALGQRVGERDLKTAVVTTPDGAWLACSSARTWSPASLTTRGSA